MNDLEIRFCDTLAEVEKKHILHVLQISGNSNTLAAKRLGIGLRTLVRKKQIWREESKRRIKETMEALDAL